MSCYILGPQRIADDDDVMREMRIKQSKQKKDDVVSWCGLTVFADGVLWMSSVFGEDACAHRKHKYIVWPTMASNWLEVVQNYNYIKRATEKTPSAH